MNKKTLCWILAVLVVMLIAGCGRKDARDSIDYDFRQGTKGLEMSFVESSPPNELYESSEFLISADVANEGAYDITEGIFALGLEDDYMEIRDWNGHIIMPQSAFQKKTSFDILGKSQNLPDGEKSLITVRARTKILESQTEVHTSQVLLTACYPYKTILVQEVCIDPDVYKTKRQKNVCESLRLDLTDQGGPVAVTRVEPAMLASEGSNSVRAQFTIYIRNVGNGEVFDLNSVEEACSSSQISRENLNAVRVSAKVSDRTLQCTPQPLHLNKKEGIVRCLLESGFAVGSSAFVSPLVVELSYGYSFTISKSVIIRRLKVS
jgi:hypothetical protein